MSDSGGSGPGWWRRGIAILAGRGGDTLLRLAIFPATALVLSASDFSAYALLTAALATGQALFALGAPRAAALFHRRGERGSLFAWLFLLASAPCALGAGLLLARPDLRQFWFGSIPPALFWIGIAPLPLILLADSVSATLLASGRERMYAAFLWGRTLAAGLVLLTSLLALDRLGWILGGRLVIQVAAVAALVALAGARPRWSQVGSLAGPALRFGAPVALAGLLAALHRRADVFLLSGLGRAAEIGAYALAYATAESLWILTDSLEAALFVDMAGRDKPEAHRIASAALRRFALMAAAAGLVILAAGEAVLLLVFHARYPGASRLLPPLVAAAAAWGAVRPAASYLYVAGRGFSMVLCQAACLAMNLALCLVLIPRLGAFGAACASLASYSALGATVAWTFRRSRP